MRECPPLWHQWNLLSHRQGGRGYIEERQCSICGVRQSAETWMDCKTEEIERIKL